jgi:hypothetical protein
MEKNNKKGFVRADGSYDPYYMVQRAKKLKAERITWETHWQEIADYFLPSKNTITVQRSPGDKRNLILLDNTGVISLQLLGGALHGLLTNPDSQWFEYTTGDNEIDVQDDVRLYFEKCGKVTLNVLNNSNFQTEVHEFYLDIGGLGTAAMDVEEDQEDIVRFQTRFIKEVVIDEDAFGRANQFFRIYQVKAKDVVEMFKDKNDKVPKSIEEAVLKDADREYTMYHGVYPRIGKKKAALQFVSQYVLETEKTCEEIRNKGFREQQRAGRRGEKQGGDKQGFSRGIMQFADRKL